MASEILSFEEDDDNLKLNLERLVAGVEDVTDPSSMDKVLHYLEEIKEEDDNFMELLTEKLQYADIYWEQPWYQKEKRLCRPLKSTGNNEATSYRTDTICLDEHNLIAKNWRKFKKKYKLPDKLVCLARWKNKEKSKNPKMCPEEQARRYVTAYLARGLQRNNYQVFQHIVAHYAAYRKGFYSATEQKIIDIFFHHKSKLGGRELSAVLGREPRGVCKRLAFLDKGRPEKKRLKWNLPLASKFLNLLLDYSNLELDELKNRKIDKRIWNRLEDDLDQSVEYLQHFWYNYLHVQLFVRCDIKLNKLKKKLFKKLRTKARDSTYKVWSDIRWKDIISDFPDGFTIRFLYRICYLYIRSYKGYITAPLEDIAEYALEKIKKQKLRKQNKRLRTLRLNEEGVLEVFDYRLTENN